MLGTACIVRACADRRLPLQRLFVPLMLLTLVGVQCLNGSPYYDGMDGSMRWLAPLAVLGGIGAARLQLALSQIWAAFLGIRGAVGAHLVLALLLMPAFFDVARAYPIETGYHNVLVGGMARANELGMETRSDHFLPKAAIETLNAKLPYKARLAFQPAGATYRRTMDLLRKHQLLRSDIESAAPFDSTYLAVPRAPAYPMYNELAQSMNNPLYVLEHSGIRHLTVYQY
jgi:hypothetical protein